MQTSRRSFLITSIGVASVAALANAGTANAAAALDENDPAAKGLGYQADSSKVDKAKHATYAAGQQCSSCQLWQGKAGDAAGPCPLFGGKLVQSKGWCTAYVKKAA